MKPTVLIADRYEGFLQRLTARLARAAARSGAYDVVVADMRLFMERKKMLEQRGERDQGKTDDMEAYVTMSDGLRHLCDHPINPPGDPPAGIRPSDAAGQASLKAPTRLPASYLFAVLLPDTIDASLFYRLFPAFRSNEDNITVFCFSDGESGDASSISRDLSVTDLHRRLLALLPDATQKETSPDKPRSQVGSLLAFSESFAERAYRYVAHCSAMDGDVFLYVPIMPLYRIREPFQHGPGRTLGDLIDRINALDPPENEQLGRWLYWHENGYYTFRLPERADDLVACSGETLRQLVHVIRSYAVTREEKMTVWIDARGLSLSKRQRIASQCDFLYVETPDASASSAAAVARREISLFLAGLPDAPAILELPPAASSAGG